MRTSLMTSTMLSLFATLSFAAPALAQQGPAPDEAPPKSSEQVTVTATRTEKRIDEVPVTVTVIDDKKIEDELATDIKDLIRFEPGVSVATQPNRFSAALAGTGRDGNAGFNIRGLQGNRVLIQVDGVRVPDAYSFGAQSNGRGDYVDLDLLKSVEILRGPTSALYGSDGVAGAVSFITRDPGDLVKEGRNFGVRARSAYASADDSWANSIIGATEVGDWSAMLSYTRRDSHEQDNKGEIGGTGSTRTKPSPTDIESNSYLGKIVWAPGDNNRFRFTYDRSDHDMTGFALSSVSATVNSVEAIDTSWRERFSFDHEVTFGEGFLRKGQWAAYTQSSKTRQYTYEDRTTLVDRIRDTTFDNRVSGANGQVEAGFATGPAAHTLIVGADYSKLTQSSIRTGTVPPVGEVFPSRAFPLTDYELTGIFVQDEISFLDGQLLFYPALRYDAFELNARRDSLYPTTLPATSMDDSHISPKLGIVAWPSNWLGAFLNVASGYKAPAPSQVNNGFSNPIQGYTSISNANLKPETSDSVEVGVRLREIDLAGAQWSGNVTAFASDYTDFIEQSLVGGQIGNPMNPGVYQYINLTDVTITGVEARVDGRWANGVGFIASASRTEGTTGTGLSKQPLQSIDPVKAVAGLTYADPAGKFGGQFVVTYSDTKQDNEVAQNIDASTTNDLYTNRSFVVLDLTAYWNITDWLALRVGAFNLTDEKYAWWSDVRGLSVNTLAATPPNTYIRNPQLDAFTQPGRNYSASLTLRY